MKLILQVVVLVLIIGLIWYSVKKERSADFKYNLPQQVQSTVIVADSTLPAGYKKTLQKIPLVSGGFQLNTQYENQLENLYAFLFDSLKLDQLPVAKIPHTNLADLDAATVIQLLAFQENRNEYNRKTTLTLVGLLLKDKDETLFFVQEYLMRDRQWLFTMLALHRKLMEDPKNSALNHAYLAMVQPASTNQTLDYLIEIQFLDRGPTDEYYDVNKSILERFDKTILRLLLDKVDDYSWYAAYPERDAEQGILEILEER
jgi:hypothetical protein